MILLLVLPVVTRSQMTYSTQRHARNQGQHSNCNYNKLTSYWQLQPEGPSPSSTLCNCHYVQAEPAAGEGAGWVVLNTQQLSLEWQYHCSSALSLCNDLHNGPQTSRTAQSRRWGAMLLKNWCSSSLLWLWPTKTPQSYCLQSKLKQFPPPSLVGFHFV